MIVHAQQVGQLPPSDRDFQVFERIVVEGATTRVAAAEPLSRKEQKATAGLVEEQLQANVVSQISPYAAH